MSELHVLGKNTTNGGIHSLNIRHENARRPVGASPTGRLVATPTHPADLFDAPQNGTVAQVGSSGAIPPQYMRDSFLFLQLCISNGAPGSGKYKSVYNRAGLPGIQLREQGSIFGYIRDALEKSSESTPITLLQARFHACKAAIKLYAAFDLKGSSASGVRCIDAQRHPNRIARLSGGQCGLQIGEGIVPGAAIAGARCVCIYIDTTALRTGGRKKKEGKDESENLAHSWRRLIS